MTIHNIAVYCPICLRVECRCGKSNFGASIISSQDEPSEAERARISRDIRESKAAKRAADNRQPPPVEIQEVSYGAVRQRRSGGSNY